MTTINLKDFYPWYTHDEYIEVSEEVAEELRASRLYEAAYQRRVIRNKAQYSLDCEDGIEYSAWSEWRDLNPRPLGPDYRLLLYPVKMCPISAYLCYFANLYVQYVYTCLS